MTGEIIPLFSHGLSATMRAMKILGIDPGFGRCGFAVMEVKKEKHQLLTFGTISTSQKDAFPARLAEIAKDFQSLLQKFSPDVVSIEDLFFVQNVTTGLRVAAVRGVLLFLSQKAGCRIVEPKPVEVKSAFTGNGKAGKTEMKKMARLLFHLPQNPKLDDAADAVAIAFFAAKKF